MQITSTSRALTKTVTLLLPLICLTSRTASAANLYWDLNGVTAGASATPTGAWNTTAANWNLEADGVGVAPVLWTAGQTAVFSAGADATGPFAVTITGTHTAAGVIIEEGLVSFTGSGAASIGAGSVTIHSGATLSLDNQARITATAGSKLFLNGGTIRNVIAGANGTFYDQDAEIVLGADGGTLSYTTAGVLNIIQTPTVISGSGSLTKAGAGILAIAGTGTYTGPTFVTDGEFRIRGTPNRLPITTAVTVTSPGILNLNGINQQIGSLSGNGSIGLGNAVLTVGDVTDTAFSGDIQNVRNAGGAAATGNGKLTKVGAGTLVLSGNNTYTGSFTLSAGTVTVTSSGTLCGSIADLAINGGALNLNNAAQTVANLGGTGGTINLGSGHVLTSDPGGNANYSGSIAGPGSFVKSNVLSGTTNRTLILGGANSYLGTTTVTGGTLQFGKQVSLYNNTPSSWTNTNIVVAPGATLGLNVGGTGEFTSSDINSLTALGTATGGFGNGSSLALDTTNAASGNFNHGGNLENPNGGANVLSIAKIGTGKLTLSGANSYTGTTKVTVGTLQFAQQVSLYNNTPASWTDTNISVASGATLALNIGGAGEFNSTNIDTLSALGSATGGFATGANLGLDTTNAPAGSFIYGGVIANPNAGANALGLTKIGTGTLTLSAANTYTGTTTVSGGTLAESATGSVADTSNLTVNGATSVFSLGADHNDTVGTVTLAGGGSITGTGTSTLTSTGTFAMQNGTVSAILGGIGIPLDKTTTGAVTLAGANIYTGGTIISAGTLLVTGSLNGTAKVDISGTLGGIGTITPTTDGNINLLTGGKISPGTSVGNLTLSPSGTGVVNLAGATDTANSQALLFELDTIAASDRITLTSGVLGIGVNTLEFDDFVFTLLGGFGVGDYVLFDGVNPISTSFGPNVSGTLGGLAANLEFGDGGRDIVLHVAVPEPGSVALVLGGIALLASRRRRQS